MTAALKVEILLLMWVGMIQSRALVVMVMVVVMVVVQVAVEGVVQVAVEGVVQVAVEGVVQVAVTVKARFLFR